MSNNVVNLLDDEEDDDDDCKITGVVSPNSNGHDGTLGARNGRMALVAKTLVAKKQPPATTSEPVEIYSVQFQGMPVPKARPVGAPTRARGAAASGGRFYVPRTYDPQKAISDKLRKEARVQLESKGITEFPIYSADVACFVEIEFYRCLPNDCFVDDDRNRELRSLTRLWNVGDTKMPDVDNLAKMYVDALQGVFYQNDAQVVRLVATKMVDIEPPHEGRTVMWIRSLQMSDLPRPLGQTGNQFNLGSRLIDK